MSKAQRNRVDWRAVIRFTAFIISELEPSKLLLLLLLIAGHLLFWVEFGALGLPTDSRSNFDVQELRFVAGLDERTSCGYNNGTAWTVPESNAN
jgi:hypothetical protein